VTLRHSSSSTICAATRMRLPSSSKAMSVSLPAATRPCIARTAPSDLPPLAAIASADQASK
jgi:hypothetical protein